MYRYRRVLIQYIPLVLIIALLFAQSCFAEEITAVPKQDHKGAEWSLKNYGEKGQGNVEVKESTMLMTSTNTYNVWEQSDEFTFYSQSQTYEQGKYSIADVKIVSIDGDGLHKNTSAGLMMRESGENGAKNVMWRITKSGGLVFTHRDADNDKTAFVSGPNLGFPVELRLVRKDNQFSAYYKENNQWKLVNTFQINMGEKMLVGVGAFTVDDKTSTSTFKDYRYDVGAYSDVTAVKQSEWVLNNFGDKADGSVQKDDKDIKLSTSGTLGTNASEDSVSYYAQEFICSDAQNNTAVVTIQSLEAAAANENAFAGIMFRESNTKDAKNVRLTVSLTGGMSLSGRPEKGGKTEYGKAVEKVTFPITVKLERFGEAFSAYYQVDGKWKHFDDIKVKMDAAMFAGLCASSYGEQPASAVFGNYSMVYEEKLATYGDGLVLKTYGKVGKGTLATDGKNYAITSTNTAGAWGEADATTYLFKEQSFPYDQCSESTAMVTVDKFVNDNGASNDGHGIMMRSADAENSAEVCFVLRNNYKLYIFYRSQDGDVSHYTSSDILVSLPLELKLVRKGDSFSGFAKIEDQWKQIGSTISASLGTNMLVGMCTWSAGSKPATSTFSNWKLEYSENYYPPEENYVDTEPADENIIFRDNFKDGSLTNGPESVINPIWPGIKFASLPKHEDGTRYWRFEGTKSFSIGNSKLTDYEVGIDFSFDPEKKSAKNYMEIAVRVKAIPLYSTKKYMAILQNSQVQFQDSTPNWTYYRSSVAYTDGNKHNLRVRAFDNKITLFMDGAMLYEYVPTGSPRTYGEISLSFQDCYVNLDKVEVTKIQDPINGDKDNFLGYGFDHVLEDYHFKWIK